MVARSAYAQLHYSPLLLAGTVAGMLLTYLAPPLLALFASGAARVLGLVTWLLMAIAFLPTLRFYRLSPFWGLALPAIALPICCSPSIPPTNMCADGAESGRGARRPTCRGRDDDCG